MPKALLMVRLADSYRRTGDHEQAAAIADRARRLAAGMQSARVARALRGLRRRLPAVRLPGFRRSGESELTGRRQPRGRQPQWQCGRGLDLGLGSGG